MKVISNSFANTQTGFTEGSFCWSNSRTQHMQTQAKFRGKYKCDRKIAQWKMPLCNKHVFCLLPFWGFSNFYVVRRARATILLRTAGGLTAYISACKCLCYACRVGYVFGVAFSGLGCDFLWSVVDTDFRWLSLWSRFGCSYATLCPTLLLLFHLDCWTFICLHMCVCVYVCAASEHSFTCACFCMLCFGCALISGSPSNSRSSAACWIH